MNILLVTEPYPPEVRAIATMMGELAEGLSQRGHRVTVLTTVSPQRMPRELNGPPKPEAGKTGVQVLRMRPPENYRKNFIIRGLVHILMPYAMLKLLKQYGRQKYDAVMVYSPPLNLGLIGNKIKRRDGARFIFNVQDIFPQNAIDLGILKNSLLIRVFESMEKSIYRNADHITAHTPHSVDFLIENKEIPRKKVSLLTNWIDFTPFDSAQPDGRFRKRYGLENKFVFLFSGIIGPSQNLDFVLSVAEKVADLKEVRFLFVGEGKEKKRLKAVVADKHISNVQIEDFVQHEDYPQLAKEMDVGLMCLDMRNTTAVYPGKLIGYMAAGLPVLAFLHEESDGHLIIREAGCGYSCHSDNSQEAENFVRKMFLEKDRLSQCSQNGLSYARRHFEKETCLDCFEEILAEMTL